MNDVITETARHDAPLSTAKNPDLTGLGADFAHGKR